MIAIASDHAGFSLKRYIVEYFKNTNQAFIDLGCHNEDAVDYPDYSYYLVKAIAENKANKGILICGTGIGMSISANRFLFIRAALCINPVMAKFAREHNDANVLVLGARVTEQDTALECVKIFENTIFTGKHHQDRVNKLMIRGEEI
jgi:ribose 5-phosphate isomerase B